MPRAWTNTPDVPTSSLADVLSERAKLAAMTAAADVVHAVELFARYGLAGGAGAGPPSYIDLDDMERSLAAAEAL